MNDAWSWFRGRADEELGDTPEQAQDRLGAVLAAVRSGQRRRTAEVGAAVGVVLLSVAVLGVAAARGGNPLTSKPSLPAPTEETGRLPGDVPGIDSEASPTPRVTITTGRSRTAPVPSVGVPTRPSAPPTTPASATSPTGPTTTSPRRTTPAPPPPPPPAPPPPPTPPPPPPPPPPTTDPPPP